MGTQKSQNLPDQGESGQPRRNRENLVLRPPRAALPRSGTVKSAFSQDSCQAGDRVTLPSHLYLLGLSFPICETGE